MPKFNFDAFELSELTGGHPLAYAAVVAFERLGLIRHFDLDAHKLLNYMKGVEQGMLPNDYHNKEHAADVFNSAVYVLVHVRLSCSFGTRSACRPTVADCLHVRPTQGAAVLQPRVQRVHQN